MLARIRKAVAAAAGAGVAAGLGSIAVGGALTKDEVSKALGVAIVAAAGTGWATWRIENDKPLATGGVIRPGLR